MTHILLIFDAQSMLTFEEDQPAALLVENINQGKWIPPPPAAHLISNLEKRCLRAVSLGNWVIASLEEPHEQPRASMPLEIKLSPRQREVLDLLSQGLTSKQIGLRLGLSRRTINYHITALKAKLQAETNAQSVGRATALGFCRPHMRRREI